MTIEVDTITLPSCLAGALINGDFSSIGTAEAARCSETIGKLALEGWSIVDVARRGDGESVESRFTWNYYLYVPDAGVRGGEVLDYVMHRTSCRCHTCSLSPLYISECR